MADTKITALTADTSPSSDDLTVTVNDPGGTPANRKVTLGNLVTKAHGLSDGIVKVASGTMAVASSGTDYAPATSGTGVLKGNGSGGFSTATANTDYYAPKAKLDATTAPGSSNDNTQGYAIGSVWVDVTNDKSYIAVDVSTGAAVWNDLTASAGGGINNVVEDLTPQLGGDLDLNGNQITSPDGTDQINIPNGTVDLITNSTSRLDITDSGVRLGGANSRVTTILDEDSMTSDSDTALATQQSIKAYADTKQPLDADLTTLSTAFTSASALGPASLAFHEDTDNGTNKITLSGQSALGADQVLTLPDATDTLVGKATTDTLTNKTLTTPTIGDFTNATHTHQNNAGGGALDAAAIGTGTIATARLGSGTANSSSYLRGDQTWATISSGGQTLVDIVVAASGGDYTTLGAALTAATSGQTIFVRSGTYSESAITITTTNLTIIGESRETTIISMGANNITLSGTGLKMFNIRFESTTGLQAYTGTFKNIQSCSFSHGAGTAGCSFIGANSLYTGNRFISTETGAGFRRYVFTLTKGAVVGNTFLFARSSSAGTQGAVEFGGDNWVVSGNYFECTQGYDVDKPVVGLGNTTAANGYNFTGNTIVVLATPTIGILTSSSTTVAANITGNNLYGVAYRCISLGSTNTVVSGNSIYNQTNTATYYGIYDNGGSNVITGNLIYGPGTTATAGIYINGVDNTTITGNRIYRHASGIQIAASSDNTIIGDNIIEGATTPITDAGTGTQSYNNVGTGASLITTTKQHVYMKNTSGGALAAGDLVVWKAVANGDEITTTTTAGDDKVFGVVIEAISNNAYGRVQTLGKNTQLKVNGTTDIAVGDPITTYTSAGIGAKATTGDMVIGYALEAYIGDDSNGVIDVLLVDKHLI